MGVEIHKTINRYINGEGMTSTNNSNIEVITLKVKEEQIFAEDTYEIIANL